jgi:replication factor C large subunit
MKNHIWTAKYTPSDLSAVQGQNKGIAAMLRFVEDFPNDKAALLSGSTGVGKTSSVVALAKEKGLEIYELNASDFRTESEINATVKNAVQQRSLFGKGKIILIDEIDGISGTKDRGGLTAIGKLIEITKFPIFLITSDPYDRKFNDLRKKTLAIDFPTLRYTSIIPILRRIAESESIEVTEEAFTDIAQRSGGDARAAILDMQSIAKDKVERSDVETLSDRDREEKILNALIRIFKTTDEKTALGAFDALTEDIDQIILWIDENLPHEYKKPEDLARAYERIVRADILKARIRRRQHWRFLAYIFYELTAGIAISKDEKYQGFVRLRPTQRILSIWKANMKRAAMKGIAETMRKDVHQSTREIMNHTLPFVRYAASKKPEFAKQIIERYELADNQAKWIRSFQ